MKIQKVINEGGCVVVYFTKEFPMKTEKKQERNFTLMQATGNIFINIIIFVFRQKILNSAAAKVKLLIS